MCSFMIATASGSQNDLFVSADWPWASSHASTVAPVRDSAPECTERDPGTQQAEPVRGREEVRPRDAAQQMKRGREMRKTKRTEAALRMMEQKLRLALDGKAVLRADHPQKVHRAPVARDKDVLAVVDDRPRGFVDERISASAGCLSLFEENNRDAAGGEVNGGGKPAEAPADDDNRVHSV